MLTPPRVRIISPIPSSDSPELEDVREEDDLPMHHQVLYNLLGEDKAESILNPKIEEPTRRQSIHPNGKAIVLLPSIDTGMGAEAIWRTLKDKSDRRINRLEEKIPTEWKQAYSAFLRDRLSKNKPMHFRSFTDKPDVPDLDVLKQQDYIYKVRKIRNHTNVMYRSSENNLNHTSLLLNNNPLPECKRDGKHISLNRYFDERYLRRPESADIQSIEYPQHGRNGTPQPKNLHFLTNEGAKCKGTFYDKYAHEDSMKMVTDVPGYEVRLPPAMTSRYTVSAPVNTPLFKKEWRKHEKRVTSAKWEPLTVGSLMEYAPSKPILGAGGFRHGTASRWRTSASAGQS